MKAKITIKKISGIVVKASAYENEAAASTFMAAMMNYGYSMTEDLYRAVKSLSNQEIKELYHEVMPVLQELKGSGVNYIVMYPNFPAQVMKASRVELFVNALTHYWSLGQWMPMYDEVKRELGLETNKVIMLDLVTEDQYQSLFTHLLTSNESLSADDKSYIEWFIQNETDLTYPDEIPFKENMCVVAGLFMQNEKDISAFIKTATDILRLLTYLSGGDVSLAENTKFKTLSRKYRRLLVKLIEKVASEEDVYRHKNKWIRAFHSLHVGDYSDKVYALARKFRNNEKVYTFNGKVQYELENRDLQVLLKLLSQRAGEFARRLDHLYREFPVHGDVITEAFLKVAGDVSTKVLLQVLGHFYTRVQAVNQKVIFPKGNVQRAKLIKTDFAALDFKYVASICNGIESVLVGRFAKQEDLGKVWIEPELMYCPIPSQQRSASEGLFSVARGTRLPLGSDEKNTLRFFIYWVGKDIDLSATLHDEDFNLIEYISYTNLKSAAYQACHSGDITSARNGASEFIDISLKEAYEYGARYVAMNVLVYSGPTFAEHEKCHVGWMLREKPQSNEIYEPASVQQKIDLMASTRNVIPAVFDLKERKMIYCDLSTMRSVHWGGNNVESNAASIEQTLRSIVQANNKVTLYKLFEMHAQARGELVETKEAAETVFSLDKGITPYDINVISSEYIA
ncbi:MAG: TerD family protein [Lentisphaerales bacterium]|nr:TerD family protein [Lentisphaerales bacterium]